MHFHWLKRGIEWSVYYWSPELVKYYSSPYVFDTDISVSWPHSLKHMHTINVRCVQISQLHTLVSQTQAADQVPDCLEKQTHLATTDRPFQVISFQNNTAHNWIVIRPYRATDKVTSSERWKRFSGRVQPWPRTLSPPMSDRHMIFVSSSTTDNLFHSLSEWVFSVP